MSRRVVLALAGVLSLVAATASAGGRNLQYFPKDIPQEDLKAEMKVLKVSLGVDCSHCHQMQPKRDFTVDLEHKKIARSMLVMTEKLNKECFTKEFLKLKAEQKIKAATCYMCHKGKEKPEYEPKTDEHKAAARKFEEAAKDDEHKDLAASMKRLVDKLNKDVFTWKKAPRATCWMCHRGSLEIETKAPVE